MPLAILPVMIFGGLFVNLETIPDAFHWLQYISPIKYSYNAMLLDEFGALTNLTCTVQQQKPDGSCPFDNGEQARSASGSWQSFEPRWLSFVDYEPNCQLGCII